MCSEEKGCLLCPSLCLSFGFDRVSLSLRLDRIVLPYDEVRMERRRGDLVIGVLAYSITDIARAGHGE